MIRAHCSCASHGNLLLYDYNATLKAYKDDMAITSKELIDTAVQKYIAEPYSVAAAAALAGVPFDRMKEILAERGVALRLGPETLDEARDDLNSLRRMRADRLP